MVAVSDFWENFFLFLIFLPLAMVWAFALLDIFRRDDIGGGWKALWVAAVILVPFFGTLMYLITRPAGATAVERQLLEQQDRELVATFAPSTNGAGALQVLADLHDRGKLTDDEFAAEKAKLLGTGTAAAA